MKWANVLVDAGTIEVLNTVSAELLKRGALKRAVLPSGASRGRYAPWVALWWLLEQLGSELIDWPPHVTPDLRTGPPRGNEVRLRLPADLRDRVASLAAAHPRATNRWVVMAAASEAGPLLSGVASSLWDAAYDLLHEGNLSINEAVEALELAPKKLLD